MRRSNAANSAVVAVAILSAVCFVALFEYPEDAYAEATYDITFDLNGGSINGQSSFVKTVGELNATGLPDASGSTIPSGKECVRRVERKSYYLLQVIQCRGHRTS